MPKQRRAIRRQFIIVLAIVLIGIVSVFKIPSFLISRNLGDLGYDKEAQKAIIDKKISKLLIDNDYYSKLLNELSKRPARRYKLSAADESLPLQHKI